MELNVTGNEVETESPRSLSLADFEANRITERRLFEDDPSLSINEELLARSSRC